MVKSELLLFFFLLFQFSFAQFEHPGLLISNSDIERIKFDIKSQEGYSYNIFKELELIYDSSLIPNPIDTINVGYGEPKIGEKEFFNDGDIAYSLALLWVITSKEPYLNKAIDILNAWSLNHKAIINNNRKLITSMGAIKFLSAAELIKHTSEVWTSKHQNNFKTMVLSWYQIIKNFAPNYNGNWDACVIQTMIAIGIYLDDYPIFIKSCHQLLFGSSNGNISNYINEKGQTQESGRDQIHVQMGLAYLSIACEMAWVQGIDLYSAYGNRLLKGFEYTSKFMLGEEVDYKMFKNFNGEIVFGEKISQIGRGVFHPIYGLAYNHYVIRKQLQMPYTKKALSNSLSNNSGRAFLPFLNLISFKKR